MPPNRARLRLNLSMPVERLAILAPALLVALCHVTMSEIFGSATRIKGASLTDRDVEARAPARGCVPDASAMNRRPPDSLRSSAWRSNAGPRSRGARAAFSAQRVQQSPR
jgi:hypothetical protein